PLATLFPYTTLFRSPAWVEITLPESAANALPLTVSIAAVSALAPNSFNVMVASFRVLSVEKGAGISRAKWVSLVRSRKMLLRRLDGQSDHRTHPRKTVKYRSMDPLAALCRTG